MRKNNFTPFSALDTLVFCEQGGRAYNEDSVRCEMNDHALCAIVADGLGGHGGGDVASKLVADIMADGFIENSDLSVVRRLCDTANEAVIAAQTNQLKMKSTVAALFITGCDYTICHVGDSRVYHFFDGALSEQTTDHSVPQMDVLAGEITPDEIRAHPDRNRLLRAFGLADNFRADISDPKPLASGIHHFILCTDGFWEYVLESEMISTLAQSNSLDAWKKRMLKLHKTRRPKNCDNYSAILLKIIIRKETRK